MQPYVYNEVTEIDAFDAEYESPKDSSEMQKPFGGYVEVPDTEAVNEQTGEQGNVRFKYQ